MELSEYINLPQFSVPAGAKNAFMLEQCKALNLHHYSHSAAYARICDVMYPDSFNAMTLSEIPLLPVSLFKKMDLKSIDDQAIYKILMSSGTTGTVPSKIYLDTKTSQLQTLALSKILGHVLGNTRMPMLIIDSKDVIKNRESFTARGAAILGMAPFGKDHTYLLNDQYEIDKEAVSSFFTKYSGKPVFIFGFTFMVWQYLLQLDPELKIDLSQAVLLHSGGWKKMTDMAVNNEIFKATLFDRFGLSQIYNYYGMVEQVGTVFLENSQGYLHCPNFSDIIIRNPVDFSVQPHGAEGLIQVISVLPKSYPGFSLLTEDIGICMGEDNAENGWKGKYFKILGRAKKAELRGCSDTFAYKNTVA